MDEETINNVFQAYSTGRMSPQEAADYEADVKAGTMQVPQGASLGAQPPATDQPPTAQPLDPGIIQAYKSGEMTREDKMQLEEDVSKGLWQLPPGEELGQTEELGFFGRLSEQFTGAERTTPEVEALPDWASMPEMNDPSLKSFKTALGTMVTNPSETVQILKSNYPDINVRRDTKGNFILQSSMDGQEYAIKPGFQVSDIPRVGAGIAAFTPAGRAGSLAGQVIGAGGTQAAIEASQAATGGEFDPEQIPLAGAAGGAGFLAGKALTAGAGGVGRAYERFRAPVAGAMEQTERTVGTGAGRVSSYTTPEALPPQQLAATAREAAEGGIGATAAKRTLAAEAMPSEKTIEAARRLGVDEYLQPDHVSTNQAFIELSQAVKSIPGSQARAAEMQGLEQVAKRADNLIDELGGMQDLSLMDKTVKARLTTIQEELGSRSSDLYNQVNANIPAKTPAPATNLLSFLNSKVDELGGEEFLEPLERQLVKQLNPKSNPTYARLDNIRKKLTTARVKKEGQDVYTNADSGLVKKLEKELLTDQQAVAESVSPEVLDTFNAARQTVAIRKGVEDDMKALFGRDLQGTIIGDLSGSVKKLAAGDVSKFVKMVKAVPEDMRKEVVASGLSTAFGKTAKNGQLSFNNYTKWYEGLLKNKQANAALMSNLPASSRKRLSDLYRVSKGISKASKERIETGRLQVIKEELKGADGLMGSIYNIAKRGTAGAAAEAITTPLGMPGAGIAAGVASALTKGKTDALKAADTLVTSPEFIEMAKTGSAEAARKLSNSSVWKRFARAIGNPRELTTPEQWILSSFQVQRQMQEDK